MVALEKCKENTEAPSSHRPGEAATATRDVHGSGLLFVRQTILMIPTWTGWYLRVSGIKWTSRWDELGEV